MKKTSTEGKTPHAENSAYEDMLDRVYAKLPQQALSKERFEMPRVDSIIQGQRTLVKNFEGIMKTVRREKEHCIKVLTKELATAGVMEEGNLALKGKFDSLKIQKALDAYVNSFVLCRECKKPDTKLSEQKGVKVMKCEACGAIAPVKD